MTASSEPKDLHFLQLGKTLAKSLGEAIHQEFDLERKAREDQPQDQTPLPLHQSPPGPQLNHVEQRLGELTQALL
jgi:hypothetical protein